MIFFTPDPGLAEVLPMVKMTNKEYKEYIKLKTPNSKMGSNLVRAFIAGGLICTIGQGILNLYEYFNVPTEASFAATSVTMVFLGALFTGLGIYDRLAKFGGAGTLVPITGFANSIVSPALEYKSEGFITGMSAKMFVIAGPVLVFGLAASVIYGVLYVLFTG
jgi:stage V sporulation protein AC